MQHGVESIALAHLANSHNFLSGTPTLKCAIGGRFQCHELRDPARDTFYYRVCELLTMPAPPTISMISHWQ